MFGRAAGRLQFAGTIDVVETGEDALAAVGGAPGYELIVLDVNLPGISGLDVLRFLKSDMRMRAVPVIVFSSSSDQQDIQRAYAGGAAAYLTKPVGLEGYDTVIEGIGSFWSSVVAYAD